MPLNDVMCNQDNDVVTYLWEQLIRRIVMLKTWCVTDYGGRLLADMYSVFGKLPKALPWIEPSINCLHQESVLSLLVGNSECAIISMCSLMEHVLRVTVK